MTPEHSTSVTTSATFILAASGATLAFFDAHAAGIVAIVAVISFFIDWYYKYKRCKYENNSTPGA